MKAKVTPDKPEDLLSDADDRTGELKQFGGSISDAWNHAIAASVAQTMWCKDADRQAIYNLQTALLAGLQGIEPKSEIEGMLASQLLASHYAAMECYRRAMIPKQTFEGRRENLNQANKLSRTHTMLLDALNRHRGKGQQKVTVEHVHVHKGGQAIVGNVTHPGGGATSKTQERSHEPEVLPLSEGGSLPCAFKADKTALPQRSDEG
jgi:hypothetical protein